ncbi:hypothetical protein F503_01952 [Ophiostoma piceae UAMH 11346]|uniref:Uncharacterized protein n=1 Tax=Ophiostoma piceae (strain UAMH 11346) TaxID=1262450 RepID=S3BPM1_OPHP1|nr:hypothetical protein F503_01952 [Ophiostoma piceae UAMH 11346]
MLVVRLCVQAVVSAAAVDYAPNSIAFVCGKGAMGSDGLGSFSLIDTYDFVMGYRLKEVLADHFNAAIEQGAFVFERIPNEFSRPHGGQPIYAFTATGIPTTGCGSSTKAAATTTASIVTAGAVQTATSASTILLAIAIVLTIDY